MNHPLVAIPATIAVCFVTCLLLEFTLVRLVLRRDAVARRRRRLGAATVLSSGLTSFIVFAADELPLEAAPLIAPAFGFSCVWVLLREEVRRARN